MYRKRTKTENAIWSSANKKSLLGDRRKNCSPKPMMMFYKSVQVITPAVLGTTGDLGRIAQATMSTSINDALSSNSETDSVGLGLFQRIDDELREEMRCRVSRTKLDEEHDSVGANC